MNTNPINESPVWKQFETEAKKRRCNPVSLALDLLKEQIEIWEDEALDREISRDAQKSGYTEEDAVELVRQYRREKCESMVGSINIIDKDLESGSREIADLFNKSLNRKLL
ncbi:MAG: hypothetical protein LH614_04950 [Pyrinomonadaceae bacterium]|nr:hypothetical protein [Pyrinomonadaceae bacterium]